MAGGFPVGLAFGAVADFLAASTTYGTTLTASASTNTKGSYSQLIATTTTHTSWMEITFRPITASVAFLTDIAVGGAGSEIVVFPNLLFVATATVLTRAYTVVVPCSIPAGSRVSARTQSGTGSSTVKIAVRLFNDAMGTYTSGACLVESLNVSTASTSVTSTTDPGGTANTKGAYTQMVSSTTFDYEGIFMCVASGGAATMTTPTWAVDIAVGGAGSEKIIVPDILFQSVSVTSANCPILPCGTCFYPIKIPKGSRIAARAQCSVTTATGRLLALNIIGVG